MLFLCCFAPSSQRKLERKRERKKVKERERKRERDAPDRTIKRRARAFIITVTMCVRAYCEEEEMISWGKESSF